MSKFIKSTYRNRSDRGATLFTVILLGVILAAIGASTFLVSSQLSNRTVQERGASAAFQIADSAAEYVRDEYIKDRKASGLSTTAWLTQIADGTRTVASLNNSDGADAGLTDTTANVKTNTANLIQLDSRFANTYQARGSGAVVVRARVFASDPIGTFTIKATTVLPDGSEQTVVKGFAAQGNPTVPLFAVLTRNINCAFCHVKINGDTGALSHVRPGWDAKNSCADVGYNEQTGLSNQSGCTGDGIINSTNAARGDTSIKGSMLGLQKFTDDTSSNNSVTSTTLTNLNGVAIQDPYGGSPVVTQKYDGDKFNAVKTAGDLDGDGINNDIPAVDLVKANTASAGQSITIASGGYSSPDQYRNLDLTQSGLKGAMYRIPPGGTYSSDLQQKTSLADNEKSGTLILIGTKDNPITLPDNFYFDGDIIFKGYVSGNGNVTASRNVYIAGELLYKNPPGTNGSGNYSDLSPSAADAQAYQDKLSKDSLRLFAGGNAIVGDYTNQSDNASYTDALTSTNTLDNAFRQPETFIRQQFGLDSGTNFGIASMSRYFNKSNGEEVTCIKNSAGTACQNYRSITGQDIASTNIATVDALSAYDYIVKPGNVQSDGSFKKSLTDKEFRDILGVQKPKDKVTVRGGSSFLTGNYVDVQTSDDSSTSTSSTTSAPVVTTSSTGSGANQIDTQVTTTTTTTKTTATAGLGTTVTESKVTNTTTVTTTYKSKSGKIVANTPTTTKATSSPVTSSYVTENQHVPGVLYNYGDPKAAASITAVNTQLANQVERVDAYVYANRRIAGVVRGTTMKSNGGFVTKEFGILATAVESSKYNTTNITAASTACTANTTATGDPNSYCSGLLYGTDKSHGDSATDGTGLQINYDNRLAYYNAPLGNIPVGTVTFFRMGTSADRTF
jgi:Tfp pilus assembly protein PilX